MIIAHLSDFHVSRHGTRLTQLQDVARRRANGKGWDTIRTHGDWSIQVRPARGVGLLFRERLRLVDEAGAVHLAVKVGRGQQSRSVALDRLLEYIHARDRTTPQALARRFPDRHDLTPLLTLDPENLNLRFCAVAHTMRQQNPDHIVITGDLTDDAEGYELIVAGLAPFFDQGRVSVVPGNHDVYASPPLWVAKEQRKSEAEKRRRWSTFVAGVGLTEGAHVRVLGDGVLLVCLDSCHHAKVPGSASGLVPMRDLHDIARTLDAAGKHVRLACLHHHVLNPPVRGMGFAPLQAGMRLRNAKQVFARLKELNFRLVMNGHRHVGYRFHPAMAPLFLSCPSSTIGCRTGEAPFFWRIEAGADGVRRIDEVPIFP